jgi:hypothetical protein
VRIGRKGRFDWVQNGYEKGKGAKKRKGLVEVIIAGWDESDAAGGEPSVGVRELYKRMKGSKMKVAELRAQQRLEKPGAVQRRGVSGSGWVGG